MVTVYTTCCNNKKSCTFPHTFPIIFAKNTNYMPEHNLQLFFILDWDSVLFEVGAEVLCAKKINIGLLKELNTTR